MPNMTLAELVELMGDDYTNEAKKAILKLANKWSKREYEWRIDVCVRNWDDPPLGYSIALERLKYGLLEDITLTALHFDLYRKGRIDTGFCSYGKWSY